MGDQVEIRSSDSMALRPRWHRAIVLERGSEEESPRTLLFPAELELTGKDENGEKAPLLLLGRKRQVSPALVYTRFNISFGINGVTDEMCPVELNRLR